MPESDKDDSNQQVPAMQPGAVISPGPTQQQVDVPQQPTPQPQDQQQLSPQPTQPPTPIQPPAPTQLPIQPPQVPQAPPETQTPLNQAEPDPVASVAESSNGSVTWTAEEFVAHDKTTDWYVTLAGAALVLSGIFYLITRDPVTVGVVIAAALILGVYGARKPRLLENRVDNKGVTIGGKFRAYKEFKSFTVVPESPLCSIELMPLKRFAPIISMYFAPQSEDAILAVLSTQLPYEEPRHDAVDSLMRRIRF